MKIKSLMIFALIACFALPVAAFASTSLDKPSLMATDKKDDAKKPAPKGGGC